MSIDEIATEFGIKSRNKAAVAQNLRRRLKKLHPDTTGGSFSNGLQKLEYERVVSALSRIKTSTALTVVSPKITDMVAVIEKQGDLILAQGRTMSQKAAQDNLSSLETAARTTIDRAVSARYLGPKLGGAFFGAIGIFLTATADSMQQIYEQIFYLPATAASAGPIISGAFVFIGATLALVAYVSEEKEKARKRHLLSEVVFQKFLSSREFARILKDDTDSDSAWPSLCSERDLAVALNDFARIDSYLAEELASIFFERLIARNVAVRVSKPSLSPMLKLDESIAEDIGVREYHASEVATTTQSEKQGFLRSVRVHGK